MELFGLVHIFNFWGKDVNPSGAIITVWLKTFILFLKGIRSNMLFCEFGAVTRAIVLVETSLNKFGYALDIFNSSRPGQSRKIICRGIVNE